MKRLILFLCLCVALLPDAWAQSGVTVNYSFANYSQRPTNVRRFQEWPVPPPAGLTWGTNILLPAPINISVAAYPWMTNGYLTVSNLVAGIPYGFSVSDTIGTYAFTNYFPATDAGSNVLASQRLALIDGPYIIPLVVTNLTFATNYIAWYNNYTNVYQYTNGIGGTPLAAGTNTVLSTNTGAISVNVPTTAFDAAGAATAATRFAARTAIAYCQANNLSQNGPYADVAGMVNEFVQGGIWSSLVDAGSCHTNHSFNGIKGTPATVANLSAGQPAINGYTLGSTTSISLPVGDIRTNTLVFTVQVNGTGNTSGNDLIGLYGATPTTVAERLYFASDHLGPVINTVGQSETSQASTYTYSGITHWYQVNSGEIFTMAYEFSGTNVWAYWDGVFCQSNNFPFAVTNPVSQLIIGQSEANAAQVTVGSWALFNSLLTTNQVLAATRALRWLDPQAADFIAAGDSTAYGWFSIATNSIPYLFDNVGNNASKYYYMNMAQSGTSLEQFTNNVPAIENFAPEGKVQKTINFISSGYNNVGGALDGYTNPLTMFNEMSNAVVALNSFGIETWLNDIRPFGTNTTYTLTPINNNGRILYDSLLSSNVMLPTRLVQQSQMFTVTDMQNPAFSLDGLHTIDGGSTRVAAFLSGSVQPGVWVGNGLFPTTQIADSVGNITGNSFTGPGTGLTGIPNTAINGTAVTNGQPTINSGGTNSSNSSISLNAKLGTAFAVANLVAVDTGSSGNPQLQMYANNNGGALIGDALQLNPALNEWQFLNYPLADSGGFIGPLTGSLANGTGLPVTGISATGTASSSTYLRGDGSWQTPSGGGGGNVYSNTVVVFSGVTTTNLTAYGSTVIGYQTVSNNGPTIVYFFANANSYAENNLQNVSNGTNASGDWVVTADNGNSNSYYADFGANSSRFGTGSYPFGGDQFYLFSVGTSNNASTTTNLANLWINALETNAVVNIGAGNGGVGTAMTISNNLVGIGTQTPSQLLEVNGIEQIDTGETNAGYLSIAKGATNYSSTAAIQSPTVVATTSFNGPASGLTSIPAAQLTGSLPTINGANLTNLTGANVTGYVPNATAAVTATNLVSPATVGTVIVTNLNAQYMTVSNNGPTVLNITANTNGYAEVNIQNYSGGTNSSSVFTATANNGSANSYFINMGINGTNFGTGSFPSGTNNAYIQVAGPANNAANAADTVNLFEGVLQTNGFIGWTAGNGGTQTNMQLSTAGLTLNVGTFNGAFNGTANSLKIGTNNGSAAFSDQSGVITTLASPPGVQSPTTIYFPTAPPTNATGYLKYSYNPTNQTIQLYYY